jgi:two-component system, OmpR family, phosphate regulon sensor histidine kinase PhoR
VNVEQLVETAPGRVVVLDNERRVVASNIGLQPGRRLGDVDDALVLFLGELPELSAYQELRAGFTAAVSHELRTPLARLMVLIESAALPDADVDDLLEQARQEVEQARELIDDVLFLGELETGREVVSLGTTRARPVVDEVVAEYRDRAANAEVSLVVRGRGDVELPLRPRMLRVVVENLVQNSIRYAGPGATCWIELQPGELSVSDDGVGVDTDDLPRLFERFYRADPSRTTRGTGLGLAIVKHIVTSAGGTVEASGGPGRGLSIVCRF